MRSHFLLEPWTRVKQVVDGVHRSFCPCVGERRRQERRIGRFEGDERRRKERRGDWPRWMIETSMSPDPAIHDQPTSAPLCPAGECYLTEWTIWSRCQISCADGDDLGFGSVQVRSRAVVAQDPENLLQCPDQELEARPCTGQTWHGADWEGI